MAEQIPFDYKTFQVTELIEGGANAQVIEALGREIWPSGRLAVIGAPRSGKSTLAHQLLRLGGAALGTAEGTLKLMSGADAPVLVIDNFHRFIKTNGAEEAFFHLLNRTAETGQKIAIFTRCPLNEIDIQLADLRSRMGTFEVYEIASPDDSMISHLIAKYFDMRGVIVKSDVIEYLAKRVGRTYLEIECAVDALDNDSLRHKSKVTRAQAKAYIEGLAQTRFGLD